MKSFLYLFKVILFWMLFFFIQRLFFIAYNANLFSSYSLFETTKAFLVGLRLDLATASYFALFSFVFILLSYFFSSSKFLKWSNYFSFLLLLIALFVCFGNTLLYKEWQSLISKRAIAFLLYPKEVLASLSFLYLFFAFFMILFFQFLLFVVWKKWFSLSALLKDSPLIQKTAFILLAPLCLFLAARGGIQLIPINESSVYFSAHAASNHAAVNPVWYLGSSIWNPVEEENKYHFMPDSEASQICARLFESKQDSITAILSVEKPNIVVLVLESHTADVVGELGGEKGICPNLDSIAQQGILFTQLYGSGSRTDQGLVSILSGFPAQPDKSIIKYTSKVSQLPSLYKELAANGYSNSFYYGGEVEFANIGAYLRQSGVEKICSKKNFEAKQINSKWGAHDEFVLSRQLYDLQNEKEPFFSVLLTLSNHEPFETPGKQKYLGDEEGNKFRNTASYADECIGNYLREASKTKWYSHTLFILVADHGHRLPQQNDMNMAKSKHIPLLFFGAVLKEKVRGTRCTKIGTQEDIAATLLAQLKIKSSKYTWSKNLLNPTANSFAYYSNQNVLGWISDSDSSAYSFVEKKNIAPTKTNPISQNISKAYLQKLYAEFIAY